MTDMMEQNDIEEISAVLPKETVPAETPTDTSERTTDIPPLHAAPDFTLPVFSGPLDLMLDLIQKHKLNIRDIEISVLLEQFLLYLEKMQEADIEVAGEFLEMAAHLILIKSTALLPKHEVEKLKKELEGVLIEYAIAKAVAEGLKSRWRGSDIFVREPLDIPIDTAYRHRHDVIELYAAAAVMNERLRLARFNSRPLSLKPIVAKSYVSVSSKIVYVLKKLRRKGDQLEMSFLYKGQSRSEQVAVFLALLELSKYGRVTFSDDNRYIRCVEKPNSAAADESPESTDLT